MPKHIPDDVKHEAIRLRVEERLSLRDIQRLTDLALSTLSVLLRDYPLDDDEVYARMSESALRSNPQRKYIPELSKLALMVQGQELSTDRKGRIAEAAVLLRLELLGYEIFTPREGSRVDWLVHQPDTGCYIRLQVKWAKREEYGRPLFALRNGEHGRVRHLTRAQCDFFVGYDLETDTAFVIPIEQCEGLTYKTCDEQYAEAWHLLDSVR
jgi:hypothetical protein